MIGLNAWEGYNNHSRLLDIVLVEIGWNGIPVKEAKRLELAEFFTTALALKASEIQTAYPDELKDIHPKTGFARAPNWDGVKYKLIGHWENDGKTYVEDCAEYYDGDSQSWLPMVYRNFTGLKGKKTIACDCFNVLTVSAKTGKALKKPKKVWNKDCPKCFGKKKIKTLSESEHRWACLKLFKPSTKQLVRYMAFKGHKIPKAKKKNDAGFRPDTSDREALLKLAETTKDPLYLRVNEYRELEKAMSTYVEGWKPGRDGRVHPSFFKATASGQKSSKKPNAQNFSNHKTYSGRLREMVSAPEDYYLAELDCRAFHALTLGYVARDLDYMRLARLDVHSYLASHMIKQPVRLDQPDDALREQLAWIKKNHKVLRDTKAKSTILGWGFGAQPPTIYALNQNSFESLEEVKALFKDVLPKAFPKIVSFHTSVTRQAHQRGFLISQHGELRRFYEVFKFRLKPCPECHGFGCGNCAGKNAGKVWEPEPGNDYEDSIAFLPSNIAHGHFDDMILNVRRNGLSGPWSRRNPEIELVAEPEQGIQLINNIHDSLMFLVHKTKLDLLNRVKMIMEAPSLILIDPIVAPNGLSVEVEVKLSKLNGNWNIMDANLKEEIEKHMEVVKSL